MTDVKEYISGCHSMVAPANLKKAMVSNEGIDGVRITVVPVLKTTLNIKNVKCEVDNNDNGKEKNSTTNPGHDLLTPEKAIELHV